MTPILGVKKKTTKKFGVLNMWNNIKFYVKMNVNYILKYG